MAKKITSNTKLADIMKMKGGEEVLSKYNVPCLSCPMAQAEMDFLKIGDVCKTYGIDEKKVLAALNKLNT